jgi:hypothetical protein
MAAKYLGVTMFAVRPRTSGRGYKASLILVLDVFGPAKMALQGEGFFDPEYGPGTILVLGLDLDSSARH